MSQVRYVFLSSLLIAGAASSAAGAADFVLLQLTNSTGGSSPAFEANLSGDGKVVVYESDRDPLGTNADENREIFRRILGGDLTQITHGVSCFSVDASVSDDGKRVAFVSTCNEKGTNADGNNELFLWTEGVGLTQLTETVGSGSGEAQISGDGRRIVFGSAQDLTGDGVGPQSAVFLWTEGQALRRITNGPGESFDLASTRDGRILAFTSDGNFVGQNADLSGEVFVWTEGSGLRQLTKGAGGFSGRPALNADGTRIAFESDRDLVPGQNGGFQEQMFLWRSNGTFQQLTQSKNTFTRMATINAAGNVVVYISNGNPLGTNNGGFEQVYRWTENAPTQQLTKTASGSTRRPSMSSNGARIAFDSDANLAGANADLNREIYLLAQAPLATPTKLEAAVQGRRQVKLTWRDNAQGETKYEVQLRAGSGPFKLAATLPANRTSVDLTGLVPNTNYQARVRCANGSGSSAYSVKVAFKTPR
jgi:Tol biopolymer transport system component